MCVSVYVLYTSGEREREKDLHRFTGFSWKPQLITADADGACRLWDLRTFSCLDVFTARAAGADRAKRKKTKNTSRSGATRVQYSNMSIDRAPMLLLSTACIHSFLRCSFICSRL